MSALTWDRVKELLATSPVAKRAGMTNEEIMLGLCLPQGKLGRVTYLTLIMWEAGEVDRIGDRVNGERRSATPWRYSAIRVRA